jgi:hypothetical protein
MISLHVLRRIIHGVDEKSKGYGGNDEKLHTVPELCHAGVGVRIEKDTDSETAGIPAKAISTALFRAGPAI